MGRRVSLSFGDAFAACALLRNWRTTDSLPAAKSAEFLLRLAPPKAACALLRNTRATDSLRRYGTACCSIVWRPLRGLCASEELAHNGFSTALQDGVFTYCLEPRLSGLCASEEHAHNGLATALWDGVFLYRLETPSRPLRFSGIGAQRILYGAPGRCVHILFRAAP